MARTNKTFRPRFDTLETRFCMSANLVDGTLTISGRRAADTVVVTQDDDDDTIIVVENNGAAQEFASSEVDEIRVILGRGSDSFTFQLGDEDFERAKDVLVYMSTGDDKVEFKLDKQSDGDNAKLKADLDVFLSGSKGNDRVSAAVGKIEEGNFSLEFTGGSGNDSGVVNLVGELDDSNVEVEMVGGIGNDSFQVIAIGDMDDESAMIIELAGESGFDTAVTVFNGELDGLLRVRSDGGTERDVVVANLITHGDSDGQLDAIIRGGANFIIPGTATPLFDIVQLNAAVDADEVDVINLLQLQD